MLRRLRVVLRRNETLTRCGVLCLSALWGLNGHNEVHDSYEIWSKSFFIEVI